MKTITLDKDGRFEHYWPIGTPPGNAITISNAAALELSQNRATKKYDKASKLIVEYKRPFVINDAIAIKRNEIDFKSNDALKAIAVMHINGETVTWNIQLEEAKAWNVDNTVATPFIDALVSAKTGVTKQQIVTKTLTDSIACNSAAGSIVDKKQKFMADVNALSRAITPAGSNPTTQVDIDAIVVVY